MASAVGETPHPLVLVPTQAATRVEPGAPDRPLQALNRVYVAALQSVGLVPVLLPTLSHLPEDLSFVSGLLLPGGPDVEPHRYGQEPGPSTSPDAESDQMEFALASWALRTEVPLLAICRGLHVLNVALGGTLHQDLPEHWPRTGPDGRPPDPRRPRLEAGTDRRLRDPPGQQPASPGH